MFKKGDRVEVYRNQHNVLYYPDIDKGFKGVITYVIYSKQEDVGSYARVLGYDNRDTYIKLPYLKKVK